MSKKIYTTMIVWLLSSVFLLHAFASAASVNITPVITCQACGWNGLWTYSISYNWKNYNISMWDINAIVWYQDFLETYRKTLQKEAAIFKNQLLAPKDLGMISSPIDIINNKVSTANDLLKYQYNLSVSIEWVEDKAFIKAVFWFEIYDNNKQIKYIEMPYIIAPLIISNDISIDLNNIEYSYSLWNTELQRLYSNWLTKYTSLTSFDSKNYFTREQSAKFFSQFAINVLKKTPDTNLACNFNDISTADQTLKNDIITSCQLWIFKWSKWMFYPKKTISAEEVVAVLIRAKYGNQDESIQPRYTNYIQKAQDEKLIPHTVFEINKPLMRWVVWKMIYTAWNK